MVHGFLLDGKREKIEHNLCEAWHQMEMQISNNCRCIYIWTTKNTRWKKTKRINSFIVQGLELQKFKYKQYSSQEFYYIDDKSER